MEVLFVAKALRDSPELAILDVITLTDWAMAYQDRYPRVAMLRSIPQKSQYYGPKQRLLQWSASQELKIRSDDLEEMHAVTGLLLERLEPLIFKFLLSREERVKAERTLLAKVLQRYDDEFSHLEAKPHHYIKMTANNLSRGAGRLMLENFLETGSWGAEFQPGFSVITVELISIS